MLDISRTLSRLSVPATTGIDRVEAAYIIEFIDRQGGLGLAQTARNAGLFDADALARLRAGGRDALDLQARVEPWRNRTRRGVEAAVRRHALRWAPREGIARLLRGACPDGFACLNVGHTALDRGVLEAVADAGGRSLVMVHDVIPLDHPEFTRPVPRERFTEAMRAVSGRADRVLYISRTSRERAERWFTGFGRVPEGVVAAPGVMPMPDAQRDEPPIVCAIGTLEPRKNIGFLLDLWDRMGAEAPELHLIGRRGWNIDARARRLDAKPARIVEHGAVSDEVAQEVLRRSSALLFPSLAEGYGLPVAEALQSGIPVICNDLPELREHFDGYAMFKSVNDSTGWIGEILRICVKTDELNPSDVREARRYTPMA